MKGVKMNTRKVALFAPCLVDSLYPEVAEDLVKVLRKVHATVSYPEGQTCCGQPAFNAGHVDEARRAARHTVAVFQDADYVVLPSGSCAGMMRGHFPGLLGTDVGVSELAMRTYELSQFLVRVLGVDTLGGGLDGRRIAYHHGCHALRELGVHDEPVSLLRAAGAQVVAWEADDECCGFGGLFSVKLPIVSTGMADRKLDTLPEVDLVTSADGGCLMQMSGRSRHRGRSVRFRHLASVLWEAVA